MIMVRSELTFTITCKFTSRFKFAVTFTYANTFKINVKTMFKCKLNVNCTFQVIVSSCVY